MPPSPLFVGAILAAGVLPAQPVRADEFKNPPILEIRSPGDNLTIRARRGTASIPGLGEVEQVYGYDVRRGAWPWLRTRGGCICDAAQQVCARARSRRALLSSRVSPDSNEVHAMTARRSSNGVGLRLCLASWIVIAVAGIASCPAR